MSWESFFLLAFLVGFLLSVLSFFGGVLHLHTHVHGGGHSAGHGVGRFGGKSGASPINFATFAAFLAWFGGTGYLMQRYSSVWIYVALVIAMLSGVAGAAAVFWFLLKLAERDKPLDPADYEMVGVLGKVTSPIRAGGTGELIYQRDGSRKAAPARSENGAAIPRETEVIVTRFEQGIAYVRTFEEMSGESL
jgi:membrane protein implicated in regulation of membrane protease activity